MPDGDEKAELLEKIANGTYRTQRAHASAQRASEDRARAAAEAVWQRYADPYNQGAYYYYNRLTGQSQWDQPADYVAPSGVNPGARL